MWKVYVRARSHTIRSFMRQVIAAAIHNYFKKCISKKKPYVHSDYHNNK